MSRLPPLPSRRSGFTVLAALTVGFSGGCGGAGGGGSPPSERWAPGPVFLLGFDGLEPDLVARFEEEGFLPNFARLRREGAVGGVRSTIPAISPPAWTTVATGSPPADHGIWSFWIPDETGGRFVDATLRLARPFWSDLSALDRTVGIVNVPVTCPPDSVNGFMIAGFPYPQGAPLTWPAELEDEILEQGYQRDAFGERPVPGREEEWLDRTLAVGRARREIGLALLFRRRPELSFIVFTTPDRVQHHLWRFHDPAHPQHRPNAPDRLRNAIRDVYVWCDGILGEVLDRIPSETTLLVLSDHGFRPTYRGISKAKLVEELPETLRRLRPVSPSLFTGDFYFEGTADERRAFAAALERVADGTGARVVSKADVTRPEATRGYGGDLGPAVVAQAAPGLLFVPGSEPGPLVAPLPVQAFSGYHRRLGYFGARGAPIVAGPVRDFDLQDVPAMTMHLLGEAIPRRYVHNIPRRLFPPTYFVERPMRLSGEVRDGLWRPGDRPVSTGGGIEEQLRSLGYAD